LIGQRVAIQLVVEAQVGAVAPGRKVAVLTIWIFTVEQFQATFRFEKLLVCASNCGFQDCARANCEARAFIVCAPFPRVEIRIDTVLHVDAVCAKPFIGNDGKTCRNEGENNHPRQQISKGKFGSHSRSKPLQRIHLFNGEWTYPRKEET
jgi:hypothetical protein